MSSRRSFAVEQTAASENGSGCFSIFLMPLLGVLLVGALLFFLSSHLPPLPAPENPVWSSALAPFFTPEVRYWEKDILVWSQTHQLDANLIATVMQIESCGDPFARSPAGASGLFQVMPYHFAAGENPFDVSTNAMRGLSYLRRALERSGGDVRLALAIYNGGPARLEQEERWWPAETQRYVYWGSGIYEDARSGAESSPRLQEWLERGGYGLCLQARARLP